MPSQYPRCAQHGLAVAPDGLCVLCRRQANASGSTVENHAYSPPLSAAAPALTVRAWKWKTSAAAGALLLLTAAGVTAAIMLASSGGKQPQPRVVVVKVPALPEPPELTPSEQSALDRSKAVDLTASLKLLEQSEARRKTEAQLAAAQLDEQRKTEQLAKAAQQKEQLERDQARHENVARELDEQAWRKRRGDVHITMYSTEWCGVCKQARSYMHTQNIPFKDFDIERDEAARQKAHALNPRNSVPTIAIDKELLIGFSPEALEERISRASHGYKL
jgi:glutaredoxin